MAALAKESTHQVNRKKHKGSNWQAQKAWLEEVEDVVLLKDERRMQENQCPYDQMLSHNKILTNLKLHQIPIS